MDYLTCFQNKQHFFWLGLDSLKTADWSDRFNEYELLTWRDVEKACLRSVMASTSHEL